MDSPLEGVDHLRLLDVPADLALSLGDVGGDDDVMVSVVVTTNTSPHCQAPTGTGTALA